MSSTLETNLLNIGKQVHLPTVKITDTIKKLQSKKPRIYLLSTGIHSTQGRTVTIKKRSDETDIGRLIRKNLKIKGVYKIYTSKLFRS